MRRTVLLLIVVLLLLPALLSAQTSELATIEFYGAIQSVTGNTMIINGQAIDLRGAQINAPLDAGTVVHISALILDDGTIAAQLINPVPGGVIPGFVEIDGVINGIYNCGIVVDGESIDICDAEVNAALAVGKAVHVFAVATTPGTLSARWSARAIFVRENIAAPLTTPEVGAPVTTPEIPAPAATAEIVPPIATEEVALPPVGTPQILPPAITPEVGAPAATPETGETFRIEGTVQAYDGVTLVVNGQRLAVGDARIDGEIIVGEQVRVELAISGGQAVVQEITVLSGSGSPGS